MNLKKYLWVLTVLAAGCSSTGELFHSDGRIAKVASCSGPSWVSCYERAGAECKADGYETIERLSNRELGFWGTSELKQIIFVCKSKSFPESQPEASK